MGCHATTFGISAVLPADVGAIFALISRSAITGHDFKFSAPRDVLPSAMVPKTCLEGLQGAVDNVAELAYIIARWPGQWWVREHTEIWDLIQSMVHVIGEEVRNAQRIHALNEVTRLQGVVSELQLLTDEYMSVHSRSGSDVSADEADPPESSSAAVPAPVPLVPPEDSELAPGKTSSTVETASCVLTSFLFGAFAALFVVNSQRRDLALHFT
jgi:hypothetical protein